jgi:hypothetical protein
MEVCLRADVPIASVAGNVSRFSRLFVFVIIARDAKNFLQSAPV